MRLLTSCFSAVLLAACAAPTAHWEKTGASESALNADMQQCRTQARLAAEPRTREPDPTMPGVLPRREEDRDARETQHFQQCMQQKGYSARR
jgi:hypothetical protein